MARVYSTRLILAAGAGPFTYTVPAGHRAVVKCMSVSNSSAGAVSLTAYSAAVYLWIASIPGNTSAMAPPTMIVLNAGEFLQVAPQGLGLSVHVSGYVFEAP